jgi:Dynein light chain type 1
MISVKYLIIFSLFVQFLNCVEINEIGGNTKDNLLFIDPHQVTIHQNEMSTEMTADIVGHSTSVLDRISDDEKVSENITMFMEQEFKGRWLVIVGKSFISYIKIPHLTGTYINFSYKERTVAALQLKSVN